VSKAKVMMLLLAVAITGCGPLPIGGGPSIVVGAMLPLQGDSRALAQEELNGIQAAADEVNRRGGVAGRSIQLVVRNVATREATITAAASLRAAGAQVILGTYSSSLSIPAAHATSDLGLVYWETGAVADQLTGEGLARVFRVGAAGANLGRGSALFAAEQLAPRLHRPVGDLRVTVVEAHDPYPDSVAAAAVKEASARGMRVAPVVLYDARSPDWDAVFAQVASTRPDILMLSSYIPDGVAFRRAMLAHGVKVGALIGTTMAECGPDFGRMLGADAIGVFASDRPTSGFNPDALGPDGRAAYSVLAGWYHFHLGREPGEEAISGFSSAWALFHDVLPAARALDPGAIAAAARAQDLPFGSLPNGGGLSFSQAPDQLGQNLRAASVIWQWQGVNRSVTVWPPVFATGQVEMVPLPR
jgi:branched-chain amino acid transport system substrate-binding protein